MTPAVVAPAVVTMIALLLVAALIAAVVVAGYSGKLAQRFPVLTRTLGTIARLMNGDEAPDSLQAR